MGGQKRVEDARKTLVPAHPSSSQNIFAKVDDCRVKSGMTRMGQRRRP